MDFFVLLTWVFFTHQAVARSSNGVSEKLPENVPQLFTLNLDKNLKEALEGLTRVEGPLSIDLSGFITNGKSFNASFKVKIEGKASIDYAIESNTVKTTSTPTTKRAAATTAMGMETATATADDARLQKLIDDMRSADVDKPTDYMLDWGKPVNGVSDQSPNPLFVYVNETIFERPVYKALIDAFNSAIFIPDTCWDDAVEKENRHAQTIFETFTNTSVFQLGLQYLNETGLIGDWSTFRDELWKLWFGAYSRCKGNGALGSSGFEHVFMGERTEKRIVGGHHSWVIFYLEEKGGEINYNGYKRHDGDLSGVIQYTWLHNLKHVGGFNIGTSPAFDFTIFTVCTLRNPNSKRCRYLLDGYPQAIATFLKPCGENGQEKCISTTYPTQWN